MMNEATALELRKYMRPQDVILFPNRINQWEAVAIDIGFGVVANDMPSAMNLFEDQYKIQVNLDLQSNIEPFSNFQPPSKEQLEEFIIKNKLQKTALKWNFQYKE